MKLAPTIVLIATYQYIRYNAEHTALATSHGSGTTTTVVVSIEGLKGVVTRNAFTEKRYNARNYSRSAQHC